MDFCGADALRAQVSAVKLKVFLKQFFQIIFKTNNVFMFRKFDPKFNFILFSPTGYVYIQCLINKQNVWDYINLFIVPTNSISAKFNY